MHRLSVSPRFYELDPYDHVNHSVYVQYFEAGRVDLLEEIGFGLTTMKDAGISIVVTEILTRFVTPATYGDELTVETSVSELRRASSVWPQRIVRGDDVIATQVVKAAVLGPSGRPMRLPDGFAAAIEPHLETTGGS